MESVTIYQPVPMGTVIHTEADVLHVKRTQRALQADGKSLICYEGFVLYDGYHVRVSRWLYEHDFSPVSPNWTGKVPMWAVLRNKVKWDIVIAEDTVYQPMKMTGDVVYGSHGTTVPFEVAVKDPGAVYEITAQLNYHSDPVTVYRLYRLHTDEPVYVGWMVEPDPGLKS